MAGAGAVVGAAGGLGVAAGATATGTVVGGMAVAVGGSGVFVGGMAVAVAGSGVFVGGTGVCVGVGGMGVTVGGIGVFVALGVAVGACAVASWASSRARVCVGPILIVAVAVGACAATVSAVRVLAAFFTPGVEPYAARPPIQRHASTSTPPILAPIAISLRRRVDMGLRRDGVGVVVG